MEVVSIPLQGYLRHGRTACKTPRPSPWADIQVMSAGTGIFHSEYNGSSTEPVSFLQIWIIPREQDTPPAYANYDIRGLVKPNELSLILSPDGTNAGFDPAGRLVFAGRTGQRRENRI